MEVSILRRMDASSDIQSNGLIQLSEAENELYDRQIRLWGLESQRRLRNAKVLISGLNGLGAEVTKNLILSGVYAVHLNDDKLVSEDDYCSQFLAPKAKLGQNRAEASIERAKSLNPMVDLSVDTDQLVIKSKEYFRQFDVVVLIGAKDDDLIRINEMCQKNNIKFFAGDVWGTFGYVFADLNKHTFVEDIIKHKLISKPNEETKTELVTSCVERELPFVSFQKIVEFDLKQLVFQKKLKRTGPAFLLLRTLQKFRERNCRDVSFKHREKDLEVLKLIRRELNFEEGLSTEYFENIFGQIAASSAVVGGILAQEIVKAVTKKEAPNSNIFLFDPLLTCGFIDSIGIE